MLSHPSVGRDPESCLRFNMAFLRRFADFTPTHEIPLSSVSPKWIGFESIPPVFGDFQPDLMGSLDSSLTELIKLRPQLFRFTAYVPFTPSHSEEHLPPPSYRGCWHGVSRGFFLESCHDRKKNSTKELYKRHGITLLHSRDIAGSGFRPLSKIPHCCPPWESGPCLSPSVADHPKRPAKHHWLGQPLPDQLPNTTQAHQTALFSFFQDLARTVRQIPTRYAPVRHFVLKL